METSFTDRLSTHRGAAADIAACRAMLRENSRTFFAASLLLPRPVREPATALYAFCRLADDAVDLNGGQPGAVGALKERLERLYAGRPINHPADRAFSDVVTRYAIPRALPDALLEGFLWDAQSRRYEDLADIFDYAARVAGTVGVMMSLLMGIRSPDALARACDLGVAMQLSNIARDVGEDASAGRLYLPMIWMRDAGIDCEQWLAKPVFTPALGCVVQRLLDVADELYGRVGAGISVLPDRCQPGIRAARLLYAEIGREVERAGCDSVSRRAVVASARKASLLASAFTASTVTFTADASMPALAGCCFLIDAVTNSASQIVPSRARRGQTSWSMQDRVGWLMELFERLERRDRYSGGIGTSRDAEPVGERGGVLQ